MAKLVLINLFLMLLWPALNQEFTPQGFAFGFLGGLIILTLIERSYGQRIVRAIGFIVYVLWKIGMSNLHFATLVLYPGRLNKKLDSCIIGIPLTISSDLEITLLASVITLTPGTISVDLIPDADGRKVLYVHNLQTENEDQFRESIQNGFERRILQFTRGNI